MNYYFLVSCIQIYHKITHKFNTLFQRKSSKGIQRFEKRTEWYIRRWKGKSYFTCIVLAILKAFIFSRLYVWVLINTRIEIWYQEIFVFQTQSKNLARHLCIWSICNKVFDLFNRKFQKKFSTPQSIKHWQNMHS